MIPERYKSAKYEDVPEQIKILLSNMKTSKRGIYIHGDVGTGKTHIACAIVKKSYRPMEYFAMLWNTTELLREIRNDFDRHFHEKKRYEEDVMDHKDLVILDDVGSEKITDWVAETFYLIVNKRYNSGAPTIFTSNLSTQELAERIGDRTVSRIVEMCDVVELVGGDRRVPKNSRIRIHVS